MLITSPPLGNNNIVQVMSELDKHDYNIVPAHHYSCIESSTSVN